MRDRRDGRLVRGPKFEVYGTSNPETRLMHDTMLPPILLVPPFPLVAHHSHLGLHAPRSLALREAHPSIDFLPCPRYRLHHYSDVACSRFVHH